MSIEKLHDKAVQILKGSDDGALQLSKKHNFLLLKQSNTSDLTATFYEPALCLILQGAKEVITGDRKIRFGKGESLIVSHDIPVISRIITASRDKPYIALVLSLDISIIRSFYEEFGEVASSMNSANVLEVENADNHLIDSLFRLLQSTQNDIDRLVLYEQILREVHFRVLQAPYGGMLRDLLRVDSHASNILKAITIIRDKYNKTLYVPDIAKSVGMSASSFHQHFKSITASTPLQYQKELRLLEARRLIKTAGENVTTAAFMVGYESPNQFSREYTRKFSINPSRDAR